MRRTGYKLLAASSLLLHLAVAQTRPLYGGTLRVSTGATIGSLDAADRKQPDSFARNSITALIFDTLVQLDDRGHALPSLAVSWEGTSDSRRWSLHLRRGVVFHDGSPITAEAVAASLRTGNPQWNVLAEGDLVTIQCQAPTPTMPALLALPRNAIAKRSSGQGISGTGPFRVTDWQPAKKLMLAANEDCWRGRPYLDAIEIELGRNVNDQIAALETGRSGLIELPVEQSRRAQLSSHAASSPPMELIAIVFNHDATGQDELNLRNALALSLDRASMRSVLLQGAGDAQGSILPDWLTGYGSLFPSQADLARAKRLQQQVQISTVWALRYDGNDSLLRVLAERIALNAHDAGLFVKPVPDGAFEARLVRVVLPSTDAWVDLALAAEDVGLDSQTGLDQSLEQLHVSEQRMLASKRVIPLLHLPAVWASSKSLRAWSLGPGSWQLADAWLGP